MSSDSSVVSGNTKVYKLRSKKYFPIWKQKALSTASSRGYNKYLTQDVTVKTETEIDTMETNYINETDDAKRRKMKGELSKYKRERKRSLEAADMLKSCARSKDLKMLSACKSDPKKMFDKLCKKYGTEEDTDLTDLLEDFKTCKLRSKKRDPEYWFAELDEINEQLGGIDVSISKNDKEIAAHIVSNLPKGYKSVKTVIELGDDYLDDLSRIKNVIIKKYKTSHKKKTRRSKYSSDSESSSEDSSSSSDDSSRYERKSRRNRDKLALNVNEEKKDTRNQYGIIICGHCRKPGHGMATCWELHGRPTNFQNRNNNQAIRGRRKCWNCGSTEHLAHQCPNVNGNNNEGNNVQDEDEDHINSLFIGTMVHCKMKQEFRPKVRLNAYEMRYGKENPNVINDDNSWYDIGDNTDNDGTASDSSRSMSWYDICEEEEASSDEESIITNPNRKYKSDKEIARELKRLLGIDDEDEDEKIPHPNDFEDAPFVGMIRVADDDSDEEIDHSHNTTGQVRQQHVDQSKDDESNAEHIQEAANSTQHDNTVREEEIQPPSRFVGPTYYRDPYETDTDQSVGSRDSDFEAGRDPMTNDRTMREVQMGFETWLASAIEGSRIGSNDENTEAKNDTNTAEYINNRKVTRRRNEDSDDDNNNEQDSKNCNAIFVEDELNLVEEDDEWESWLADTGASCHVTNNDDCLHNKRSTHKDAIIVGDQRKCRVTQKGMLKLRAKENDETIHLDNVRVVKTIGKNIISISALKKQGGTMYGNENRITINYDDKTLTFIRNMIDGLYYTKMKRLHSTTKDNCNAITTTRDDWTKVQHERKKWPRMTRDESHRKWGHPHLDQLNRMGYHYKINLTGKLSHCDGCGLVKSRATRTTRTCQRKATKPGERLFIDTTGPYKKSRGGMKYWMCCVDAFTDKTWTYFATSKSQMVTFVREMIVLVKGLDLKVKFLRCDNAGEHQTNLKELCIEHGFTMEFTAPNTPKQNGRAEKKIHVLWQRAMTQQSMANLSMESQEKFWAEAVSTANYLEDLIIKAGRDEPALSLWTQEKVHKWVK